MHTIINTLPNHSRSKALAYAPVQAFREPAYDCQEHGDVMKVTVYVPGVAASGVEIEGRGADLTVTARKPHVVRVNFPALHLEGAQRDYRLRLRLGHGFDYAGMEAEIASGVLTITLPKRLPARQPSRLAKAA
jgi:HSP20 family molecular chaperone IbpA